MGDVSFRNWDIWVNNIYVHNTATDVSGHYECYLLPTLMVEQTVEFLSGRFQISTDNISRVSCYPLENVQKAPLTNAPLHIDIQGTISLFPRLLMLDILSPPFLILEGTLLLKLCLGPERKRRYTLPILKAFHTTALPSKNFRWKKSE